MASIILFDIDMTLIRTNGAGRAAMDGAFEEILGVSSATSGVRFDGRTDQAIFRETLARCGRPKGGESEVLALAFEAYLARLPGRLEALGGVILPGVPALLEALERSDVAVGLATGNLRRGAAIKLQHFGLWEHFSGGGFGDIATIRADLVTAGIGEVAASQGRAGAANDVVVVGDTPLDIEAAHAAGARSLAVATGRYSIAQLLAADADWALADLSELRDILDLLQLSD